MDDDTENGAEAAPSDFELETATLPARQTAHRRVKPLTAAAGLALMAAVVVIANLSGAGAASQAVTGDGPPTATAFEGSQTLPPLLTLDPATVDTPPRCALTPALDTIGYYLVPAFGGAPLWLSGFDNSAQRVVHFYKVPPRPLTPRGWIWRVLLVTNLRYVGPVTVTGDGPSGPLLFTQDARTVMTSLTLDTRSPASVLNGWGDWATYIYLPKPGCYDVQAMWPGGGWRVTFSAGR